MSAPGTTSISWRHTIAAAPTFVDTSALYAVLDRDEALHARAAAGWRDLVEHDAALFTHNLVVVELVALAQRRLGMPAVRSLADDLLPMIVVAWVDERLHRAGMTALLAAGGRDVSMVDWVSVELMRQRGIRQAFAFDAHFREQGFTLVPAVRR